MDTEELKHVWAGCFSGCRWRVLAVCSVPKGAAVGLHRRRQEAALFLNTLGLGCVVPLTRSAVIKTLLDAGRNQFCT